MRSEKTPEFSIKQSSLGEFEADGFKRHRFSDDCMQYCTGKTYAVLANKRDQDIEGSVWLAKLASEPREATDEDVAALGVELFGEFSVGESVADMQWYALLQTNKDGSRTYKLEDLRGSPVPCDSIIPRFGEVKLKAIERKSKQYLLSKRTFTRISDLCH
jgi:hypothetical protein